MFEKQIFATGIKDFLLSACVKHGPSWDKWSDWKSLCDFQRDFHTQLHRKCPHKSGRPTKRYLRSHICTKYYFCLLIENITLSRHTTYVSLSLLISQTLMVKSIKCKNIGSLGLFPGAGPQFSCWSNFVPGSGEEKLLSKFVSTS